MSYNSLIPRSGNKRSKMKIQQTILPCKTSRTKKLLTPRGGLLPYAELIKALSIEDLVNKVLPKTRSNNGFDASDYVKPLLFTLYGGGSAISHTKQLRFDEALCEAVGLKIVPSESATGDWLRRVSAEGAIDGMELINDIVIKRVIQSDHVYGVTLITDPSIIKTYKRDACMTYEGYKGYRPMMAFDLASNAVVHHEFRNGNDNGRRKEFVEAACKKIKTAGSKVKLFLGDSEFYQTDVIEYLEQESTEYIIAGDKDAAVSKVISSIKEDDWKPLRTRDDLPTDREYCESVHIIGNLKKAFRIIILRWKDPKNETKYCYHILATNYVNKPAYEVVWDYGYRATQENSIKEVKSGFELHKLPSNDFGADALFFGIGVLAYNLFILQKWLTFPPQLKKITIKTARWMFVNIAGQLVWAGKHLLLKLATSAENIYIINFIRKKTYELIL